MYKLAVLFAGIAAVTCNDLSLGRLSGRKVYDQTVQAIPAIWRQSQQLEIKTNGHETITGIVVTDQRQYKDGDAQVINGGEGQDHVKIQLQSPAVFRGFDFHVVVYAEPTIIHPGNLGEVEPKLDGESVTDDIGEFLTTQVPNGKTDEPSAVVNQTRLDSEVDAIVKYVGDRTTKVPVQDNLDVTTLEAQFVTNTPNIPTTVPEIATDLESDQVKEVINTREGLSTETSDLSTPATDLSTPASDLSTPTSDLSTPASDLSTPASDLSTPTSDLSTKATGATEVTTESNNTM